MTESSPEVVADAAKAIKKALRGMEDDGPEALLPAIRFYLGRTGPNLTEDDVVKFVTVDDVNDEARKAIHMALARWDAQEEAPWADGIEAKTPRRRDLILHHLGLSTPSRSRLNETFPSIAHRDALIATPGPWDPWFTKERRAAHNFYWRAYKGVLERSGWAPESIAGLDESTSDIISRLADPAGVTSYQTKGLVVGYVQSGKTANFTGITAKAIDAGYRLIIVLTGTIELLRNQTQRRLDMELIGEENILDGRDRNNADAVAGVDYISTGDADWFGGRFLRHGVDIHTLDDVPGVKRLTNAKDYAALKAGLDTLDFRRRGELKNPSKPVYDPENLFGTDVRIAIVKKNASVLKKLLADLRDIRANLKEIPVLIIDDEADQASVNTLNPKRDAAAERKRTAINQLISDMLKEMPRAQYLGYTATPFANVFVNPNDAFDIFPKDFVLALEPPPQYMGGRKFHDLEELAEGIAANPTNSNEKAHMRDLVATDDPAAERTELLRALDSFVLAGGIKLWRADHEQNRQFRHHTMLVHETVKQVDHAELARLIEDVWQDAAYTTPAAKDRLRDLLELDFRPVHDARDWGTHLPDSFDELVAYIGTALGLITAAGSPVVIVNGSSESDYTALDFQSGPYWRVMIGGAKLSRGFTVEGLTISYYRRRATAADTLMQMGRWFGYRPGYSDLVRLFIARDVADARGKTYDLYDAFTAIVQDEEAFRDQLRAYSRLSEDGFPLVRPIDIPPLVFQQLPWLRPAAANKMFNAELVHEGKGGEVKDLVNYPHWDGAVNQQNFDAAASLLDGLSEPLLLNEFGTEKFNAGVGVVSAQRVLDALSNFTWAAGYEFGPVAAFMKLAINEGVLKDWVVVLPFLQGTKVRTVGNRELPLIVRSRRARGDFSGSSPRQRPVMRYLGGVPYADIPVEGNHAGGSEAQFREPTRGSLMVNFAYYPDQPAGSKVSLAGVGDQVSSTEVAPLFSIVYPVLAAPRGRIGFRVRNENDPESPVYDTTSE